MKIFKYGQFVNEADLFTGSGIDGYDSSVKGIAAKSSILKSISDLRYFLVDDLRLKSDIMKLLEELGTAADRNNEYQLGLSILYKTGKFPDIKYVDGKYETLKFKNLFQVRSESGEYDPVNKLNTNYSDLAELLYDIIEKEGKIESIEYLDSVKLKAWLSNFTRTNSIIDLIKKHNIDLRKYITNNRRNSELGEINENFVKDRLLQLGCKVLYQGGDGDFVDMIYGIDLIVEKEVSGESKIFLVQVKSSERDIEYALGKYQYNNIDWFACPVWMDRKKVVKLFSHKNKVGKII